MLGWEGTVGGMQVKQEFAFVQVRQVSLQSEQVNEVGDGLNC